MMRYKKGIIKNRANNGLTNQLKECSEFYRMFLNCGSTSPECESLRSMYHQCVHKAKKGAHLRPHLGEEEQPTTAPAIDTSNLTATAVGTGDLLYNVPAWIPVSAGIGIFVLGWFLYTRYA